MKNSEREELQEKFLHLRGVENKSFDQISEEIGVSKPTLISWSVRLKEELNNLRSEKYEKVLKELQVSHLHRTEVYAKLYKRLSERLNKVDLDKISASQLLTMLLSLEDKLDIVVKYKHDLLKSDLDFDSDFY